MTTKEERMNNNGQPRRPEPAGRPVNFHPNDPHANEQAAREQLQRKIAGAEKQMRDDHMLLVAVINKCATAFERIATTLEKMEAKEGNGRSVEYFEDGKTIKRVAVGE